MAVKFTVKEQVKVPTLKVKEDQQIVIRCLQPISVRSAEVKGDDGVMRMKEIEILRVMDHEDGQTKDMVVGASLSKSLKDYKGGNCAYVGLDFALVKRKAAEGKRFKDWEVSQVEVAGA